MKMLPKLSVLSLLVSVGIASLTQAAVPEPNITLYGKVINRYQGAQVRVADGDLTWVIQSHGQDSRKYTFSAHLTPLAAGEYDYRLDIPLRLAEQLVAANAFTQPASDGQTSISLDDATQQFEHATVTVDGNRARIVPPAQDEFSISQSLRSQHLRVDLLLSTPPKDSDGDGLPDAWEIQYFGDINIAKADEDSDGDGLTNLEEYKLSSDPRPDVGDNRIPTLINTQLILHEQGITQLNPLIIDSDTEAVNVDVVIESNLSQVQLEYIGGGPAGYENGYILKKGDHVTLQDIEQGNVLIKHQPNSVQAQLDPNNPDPIVLGLKDPEHDKVFATVNLQLYSPRKSNGVNLQLWVDSTVDQSLFSGYENGDQTSKQEEWFGRAHQNEIDLLHNVGNTGWFWVDVVTANKGPLGQKTIEMDGTTYYESWQDDAPFQFNQSSATFAVFQNRGQHSQIIAHDMQSELAITSADDPVYPKRLRFSKDGHETIYAALPSDNTWGITGLFIEDNKTQLEWNTKVAGYHVEDTAHSSESEDFEEGIVWGTSVTMGGKIVGSANSDTYTMVESFDGSIGEMIVLNCGDCKRDKWRVYAYLYSKWFGYVVVDHADSTYPANASSASAAYIGVPEEYQEDYETLDDLIYSEGDWADDAINAVYQEYAAQYGHDKPYIFFGGAAKDNFIGGSEDDMLIGSDGGDWLIGMGGADLFVLENGNEVLDFDPDEGDRLNLSLLLDIQDPDIPLNRYIHFDVDMYNSTLRIDANGDGSGFTDASIILDNIAIHDSDIAKLWSMGAIQAGATRPALKLSLQPVTAQTALSEMDTTGLSFKIVSEGGPLPKGLFLPISITGEAKIDKDFMIEVKSTSGETAVFEKITTNGIPVNVKAGEYELTVRIIPIADQIAEPLEHLTIKLMPLGFYDIDESQVDFTLMDGDALVSIKAEHTSAVEGVMQAGEITLTRTGSLDVALPIQLSVVGSAQNGVDYGFISQEYTFPVGESQIHIDVVPYKDNVAEELEFVEVAVLSGANYAVSGMSSIKIGIFDESSNMDSDGDGMTDLWEVAHGLQVYKDDAKLDNDNDGITNLKEFLANTNPVNADTDGDGVPDALDSAPNNAAITTVIAQVGTHHIMTNFKQLMTQAGDSFVVRVNLNTVDQQENPVKLLSGFGVRLHYNTQALKLVAVRNVLSNQLIDKSDSAVSDVSNFDADENTQAFIRLRWDSLQNNWPNLENAHLFDVEFKVEAGFTADTQLNFSYSQLSAGYQFDADSIVLKPIKSPVFDLDEDGHIQVNTDGKALLQYMMGLDNAVELVKPMPKATLLNLLGYMDLDADGQVNPLTDGLLLMRCLAGYEGDELTAGILNSQAGRTTPAIITAYCRALAQ